MADLYLVGAQMMRREKIFFALVLGFWAIVVLLIIIGI
jgi:hypothetical protein